MPEPIDDVSIGDDERLLHRIRIEDIFIDPQTGLRRPSSATFRSKSNIISVDLASLTTPDKALAAYPHHALVEIDVGTVRSLGCKVARDPQPDNVPEDVRKAIKHWSQWIDYWAVDWDYKDDTFHNQWQSYRARKSPDLEREVSYIYKEAGKYTVVIKVIDILGNDTTKLTQVEVK